VLWTIALLVVAAVAYAGTSEEQRTLVRLALLTVASRAIAAVMRNRRDCQPFVDALRARTRFAVVTTAIVALNVIVFAWMIFGGRATGSPEMLVSAGANFGPRTTNGEWWRLVASLFVHAGLMPFVVNIAALAQLGLVLERVVGRLAFAAIYVVAGILAALVSIASHPLIVSAGASGAIAGLYGLLLACGIWDLFRPSETAIPLAVGKRLAPAAAFFLVYNAADGGIEMKAELAAFVAGLASGLVLRRTSLDCPPQRRVLGAVTAVMATVAIATAVSLRGIADVRPEIARVLEIEGRTAAGYRAAEALLWKGQTSATALADLIELKIVPEFQTEDARLAALRGVPREHRHLVADAKEYVQLRSEGWRQRAKGLRRMAAPLRRDLGGEEWITAAKWRDRASAEHRATQVILGRAEQTERASLEVLRRLSPSTQSSP
jgi:membrane associated rhomboid family serine protease